MLIVLLFILVYDINKNTPKEFIWRPTYNTHDKQPFGAYAFDQLVKESWPEEYIHDYSSIKDLLDNDNYKNHNLLIISNYFTPTDQELEVLFKHIRNGGNALIAANSFRYDLQKIFNLKINYSPYEASENLMLSKGFQIFQFVSSEVSDYKYKIPIAIARHSIDYESYIKKDESDLLLDEEIEAFGGIEDFEEYDPEEDDSEEYDLEEDDPEEDVFAIDSTFILSIDDQERVKSLRYAIGKGNLIVACNSSIFTNYGILSDSINGYIWNHLAYLQDKPLIRTEYYESGSQGGESQSEFRYILSQRSLKWAFYTTLFSILIFMIFTAKRKQKIIPIIKKPANNLVGFVKSIAALYIQKNNNADLILKKKIYWGDKLKRKYGINIMVENPDREFYVRVAEKTGQSVSDIRRLFLDLNAIDEDTHVSDEEMMDLIIKMNNIT